jgi:hypothetical protein
LSYDAKLQTLLALGGISIGMMIVLCDQENPLDENSCRWFSNPSIVTWNQANPTIHDNHSRLTKLQSAVPRRKTRTINNSSSPKTIYDFIVIGYGNAGRGAVEVLQQQCPC